MYSLDELQEAARLMTQEALRAYPPFPSQFLCDLTLGTFFDDPFRIFELYVAAERPTDAIVLTRATLDARTGEGKVEVFPECWVGVADEGVSVVRPSPLELSIVDWGERPLEVALQLRRSLALSPEEALRHRSPENPFVQVGDEREIGELKLLLESVGAVVRVEPHSEISTDQ